jgi:hypothetical protein
MSVVGRSVRGMSDGRRRRRAKQARRDARRKAAYQWDPLGVEKRDEKSSVDTTFRDALRRALGRHPLGLISIAGMMIHVARPDSLTSPDADYLDRILTDLIDARNRETTALLAVIAELLVDDPEPQLRCRREVAGRGEHLPRWIGNLSQVEVYRAVRRTHVFGDVDELVFGMRIGGGHELTVAVMIDHNLSSTVVDAGVVTDPIDMALARVAETSTDTSVFEMTLNDARTWIEEALDKPRLVPKTETWPLYRPLVQWLVSRLPERGEPRSPAWLESTEELCDTFFASDAAAPFTDSGHREMLVQLLESGTGDPVRWSAARVERTIGSTLYLEGSIPLEVALDAPDLLRAFIPFAHMQSGIRDELTSRTLAAIDTLRTNYKRKVLREANYWWLDDAV